MNGKSSVTLLAPLCEKFVLIFVCVFMDGIFRFPLNFTLSLYRHPYLAQGFIRSRVPSPYDEAMAVNHLKCVVVDDTV